MKPDMSNAFGYTEEQLAELAVTSAKRWAVHSEWFDDYYDPPTCRKCGAHVATSSFDLHIQWHKDLGAGLSANYPGVVDNSPACVCGCRQGTHLHKEPHPCSRHLGCYEYTPATVPS